MIRVSLLLALALGACGDNLAGPKDAGGDDAPVVDATPDAAPTALAPCLDRPTDLPRPPTGALPCELLPPGLMVGP